MTNQVRRITRRARGGGEITARGTIIQVQRAETNTSHQLNYIDEFNQTNAGAGHTWVATPFNVPRLFQLVDISNILRQCIEAYVTNTVGTGYETEAVVRGLDPNKGEESELMAFIDNANSEESLTAVMRAVVMDREIAGFGFMEVIRDVTGDVALLRHASSYYTRLGLMHEKEILVEYTVNRGRRQSTIKEFRRFRKFLQIVNGEIVWFKEFGDPRKMDRSNGMFEGEPGFTAGNEATEIYHFKLPSVEPYGVPRWINQIPSILGSRESEEVNLRYFKDNTVPPMMVTVAGGRLTAKSYQELSRILNQADLGSARQHKIMLLEAVGGGDDLDNKANPIQLKVEKLNDQRQSDALFQDYDKQNRNKIRTAYRLPPILLGESTDQNYANASVSVLVAESQVFGPDRDEIDEVLNKALVNGYKGMKLKTVRLKGRIASINSSDSLIKALTALNNIGAVTPRDAQRIASQVMQTELTPYPKQGEKGWEEWMDKPIVLSRLAMRQDNGQNPETTHAETQAKGTTEKQVEGDGNIGFRQPEKGSEAGAPT